MSCEGCSSLAPSFPQYTVSLQGALLVHITWRQSFFVKCSEAVDGERQGMVQKPDEGRRQRRESVGVSKYAWSLRWRYGWKPWWIIKKDDLFPVLPVYITGLNPLSLTFSLVSFHLILSTLSYLLLTWFAVSHWDCWFTSGRKFSCISKFLQHK